MKLDKLTDEQYETKITITFPMLNWMVIHGNMSLGLRHPKNNGPSKPIARAILRILEIKFIELGFADQEDLDVIHKTEQIAQKKQFTNIAYYCPN